MSRKRSRQAEQWEMLEPFAAGGLSAGGFFSKAERLKTER